MTKFEQIKTWLSENGAVFREVHHEPTPTSEDSARARGEDISIGGKALVMKVDEAFKIFVISAAHKADSKKIRDYFRAKKSRFATAEELLALTGLVPGSVPPFGKPILDLDLFVDTSVTENEKIAFNAASLTDSIIMPTADYLRLAQPTIFSFAQM